MPHPHPHLGPTPHPLAPLADLPGVADAVAQAREACERLRWHRGLRRRLPVARLEAGVRAAWAGLEADGVRVPLDVVRGAAVGAEDLPDGAVGAAVRAAVRLEAELQRTLPAPGATAARVPFAQLVARWHLAVDGGPTGGRPRPDDAVGDLRGLGSPPPAVDVPGRLRALAELVDAPARDVPGLVLAAVVQAELLLLRPFPAGNGAVARAAFRHLLTTTGVEPTAVAVPEAAWRTTPAVHLSAVARSAKGAPEGVAAWLAHCAGTVVAGATEGERVAEALAAGALGDGGSPPA